MTRIKKFFIFTFLSAAKYFRTALSESEGAYKLLFVPGYEGTRWQIGKWKAWQIFENAKKQVPAYKDFLSKLDNFVVSIKGWDPDLTTIPPNSSCICPCINWVAGYSSVQLVLL